MTEKKQKRERTVADVAVRTTKRKQARLEADEETFAFVPASKTHPVVTREVPKALGFEDRQEKLREIEDGLLAKSQEVVMHALDFASIPYGLQECPKELIEKHGPEHAQKVFRIIQAAQCTRKDAPVGLDVALKTSAAIIKARNSDKGDARPLQIGVQVVVSKPVFEVIDVDD